MKKPFIGHYIEEIELQDGPVLFYDHVTQISYTDEEMTQKAINIFKNSTTIVTETIEQSDPDEFSFNQTSRLTKTNENADPDEFSGQELLLTVGTTKQTFTIESSDQDEYQLFDTTRMTRSIEGSDPDEFYS